MSTEIINNFRSMPPPGYTSGLSDEMPSGDADLSPGVMHRAPLMDWGNSMYTDMHGVAPIVVNAETRDGLFEDLRARMRTHQGFALATMNVDHVVKLHRDASFRAAYRHQTHVVADGNPIVWLSRLSGHHIELMPGSDLTVPLAALAADENVPIALVGSTPEVLDRASKVLLETRPTMNLVLTLAPDFDFDPSGPSGDEVLEQVRVSGARFCLLAFGAPKQEIFAARARTVLPNVGFASIGAGLDFITGHQRRAPAVMRRFALEWLWRLTSNPLRLGRRYFDCFAIMPRLTLRAIHTRSRRNKA